MKNYRLLIMAFFCLKLNAQTPKDCSVELWATIQSNPPTITLNWLTNATTANYSVARKPKNSSSWTIVASSLSGATNQYVDNTVLTGTHYEYRLIRNGNNYTGYGYINSGIEVPEVDYRGKLILIVANTHSVSLANEIERLENDLEGDGWETIKFFVSPADPVTQVKAQILNSYNLDPINTKAVFLLGHVPVPYSGNLGPDGHTNHQGAWPADAYYGELNGNWTDMGVTSTTLSPARTQNVPGDGKFDQSFIPTAMELQVGRVDLWGMNSFSLTETQLLKNYLDKDHDYRKKIIAVSDGAVIDDNFGYFSGEAFAACGYKNFGPLVNPANVSAAPGSYFSAMTGTNSCRWSYGCGGGSYTSASGIGNTSNFAASDLQGIFTMMFGSYFGDWDVPDNFLRAPLCQGKILTNVWAGRPHWMFHHMAMGENIGYSTMLTQNNTNTYFPSPYPANAGLFNTVHIALMGDPTLRNHIVAPVSNVMATKIGFNCLITWSASTETNVVGYHIYMKNDTNATYVRLNGNPLTTTTFTDYCLEHKGVYKYMVRTLKLESNPSGSYYNMSEGVADTAYNSDPMLTVAAFTSTLAPNGLSVTNTSTNSTNWFWDFGNGVTSNSATPLVVPYFATGVYTISLVAANQCFNDTAYEVITVLTTGVPENVNNLRPQIWPNPTGGKLFMDWGSKQSVLISVFNEEGKEVVSKKVIASKEEFDLNFLEKGIYFIEIKINQEISRKKIVLQ